jgi:hypothetical protein
MSKERKVKRSKRDNRKRYIDADGNKSVPLSEEAIDILKEQRQQFRDKFGRDPGPQDPVWFDPDCEVPTPIDPDKYMATTVAAMREAGLGEALIYAYVRTGGMLVTKENKHLWSKEDLEEWNDALAEYKRQQ